MRVSIAGAIFVPSTATLDYETQNSYILEVSAYDGEFKDTQFLEINVADVNENPYFTAAHQLGDILETETISRVILKMDSSDPENDVLTYNILGSVPTGPSFTIHSSHGESMQFATLTPTPRVSTLDVRI